MAEYSLDEISIDMISDFAMVESITDFKGKCKADSKHREKPASKPKIVQTLHIRNYKKHPSICQSLKDKLNHIIERNSSNTMERIPLRREVIKCINMEKRRKNSHGIVTWNRRLGQMTEVWPKTRTPADKINLESAAVKDVFDMSCLTESLPNKSDSSDINKKAEQLAKEYLWYLEKKKESFRKSEIIRKLAKKISKQNGDSSSKQHRSKSLTRMVKKVCGNVKNVHIFSFRPMTEEGPKSSVDDKRVRCPEPLELPDATGENRLQNEASLREEVTYRLGEEVILLMKIPPSNTAETRSGKRDGDNLRNPERLLFNREGREDERQTSESLRMQHLRESISRDRRLRRLKNANSRRGDLSEEVGIQEASADQNKEEQGKVAIANRRREVVERLREKFKTFKQEIEDMNKN